MELIGIGSAFVVVYACGYLTALSIERQRRKRLERRAKEAMDTARIEHSLRKAAEQRESEAVTETKRLIKRMMQINQEQAA